MVHSSHFLGVVVVVECSGVNSRDQNIRMLAQRAQRGLTKLQSGSVRAFSTAPAASEAPAFTRTYGGLKDQDRIFTNLYGEGVSVGRF